MSVATRLTSAQLAQQSMRARNNSPNCDAGAVRTREAEGEEEGGKGGNELDALLDEEDSDDDDLVLVEERFLRPHSAEGLRVKLRGYSECLSPLSKQLLPTNRTLMKELTGFRETLHGNKLTVETLRDDTVIWTSSCELTLGQLRMQQLRATLDNLRQSDDNSASSSLPEAPLSVSSAVFHDHTLPLSAPPPPHLAHSRRSPPPIPHTPPFAPDQTSPPPSVHLPAASSVPRNQAVPERALRTAREELVQLYHFTAAGEHRDSTALGRLLADPPTRTRQSALERAEEALSTMALQAHRAEAGQEEVEAEREEEAAADGEEDAHDYRLLQQHRAVDYPWRRPQRRREQVGR